MIVNNFISDFFQSEDFLIKSNHTKNDYIWLTKQFAEAFGNHELWHLTSDDVENWLIIKHQANSFMTFNKELKYLRAFFNRAKKLKLLDENPCLFIALKKPNFAKGEVDSSKISRAMTRSQLEFLVKRFKEFNHQGYLIMALLAESGCRVGEALMVHKKDLRNNMIYLPITKNGSPRYICFSDALGKQLIEFSHSHSSIWLFPSPKNICKPMAYDLFQKYFNKMRRGIYVQPTGKLVTIHGIRHTFASERVGLVDLLELKELMGHQTTQTTLRYISVSKQKMQNAYEKTKHLSLV